MANMISLFSHADAKEILALAEGIDTACMTSEQIRELNEAIADIKEKIRIDAEYEEDVPTMKEKKEFEKTKLNDASNVGVTNLVDAAFVPEIENDDEVIPEPNFYDDEEVVVQKGFRGDPDDGMHHIILVDYPERQPGKNGNGNYRVLHFRDVELFNEWTMFVSEDVLVKRLQEISYNNKGMLSGMTKKRAFASLMVNPIVCWTAKNQKGRIVTYFDELHFNKYFRWLQEQKAATEDAYNQRHSKEVSPEEKEMPWKC